MLLYPQLDSASCWHQTLLFISTDHHSLVNLQNDAELQTSYRLYLSYQFCCHKQRQLSLPKYKVKE